MDQYELIKYLVNALEQLDIKYFVTGAVATIFYGEPRFTNDIDIVADINEQHVTGLLEKFPEGAFYISKEAILAAIIKKCMFNIIHPSSGLKIDVKVPGKDEFEDSRFKRVNRIVTGEDTEANVASPEDVIIMKMKYYKEGASEKHLRDITGIIKISGDIIDRKYIELWVNNFELNDIWKAILSKLE